MWRMLIVTLFFLVLPVACSYKPVRHLASDAALIKAGESTRKDVLRYLGEPDSRRVIAPGVEEYMYAEEQKNQLANLPLMGKLVAPASQEMVIVTLKEDQVASCEFRLMKKDDQDWREEAKWEPVK
ncbi:hypothetical protein [Candidatus Electronema sp. PJ]|uniref:hypothetical protein n=1 Tax=Candidatus Electronema sp. PJ TaxID=3401572 RepID=UPI003AA93696